LQCGVSEYEHLQCEKKAGLQILIFNSVELKIQRYGILKAKNKVERAGSRKTGYWKIN